MKKFNQVWMLLLVILGAVILFTTGCKEDEDDDNFAPNVMTAQVIKVTDNSASVEAEVITDGGAEVTIRGLCWCTSPNPTTTNNMTESGCGTGCFSCCMKDLSPNTTYYVRAYATNSEGTAYGNDIRFTTPPLAVDIEGNKYHTVVIGGQIWMSENLRVIHYRNGAMIPVIEDNNEWVQTHHGAYSMALNRDEVFYNAHAVFDDRGLAPVGWHVPTDAEWKILEGEVDTRFKVGDAEWDNELERGYDAGGNLKASEDYIWFPPNSGATNTSGFTAVPAGWRWGNTGELATGGGQASFWTSTVFDEYKCWARCIFFDDTRVHRFYYAMTYGGSVRCVKD
jgi:uncharacterized protein (TIGR02145 family)